MKKETSGDEWRGQRFVRRTSASRDRENIERAVGTRTKMEHRCVMSPKKRKMFMAAVCEIRRRDASSDLEWSTRIPRRAETSQARARSCVRREREETRWLIPELPTNDFPFGTTPILPDAVRVESRTMKSSCRFYSASVRLRLQSSRGGPTIE